MKENSHIDKNTFDYLKPDKPKVGRFFLLPKILSFFEDNQWCLSNVRVMLLHEVGGGNRRIRRFFLQQTRVAQLLLWTK
jgi:hypothetical protein